MRSHLLATVFVAGCTGTLKDLPPTEDGAAPGDSHAAGDQPQGGDGPAPGDNHAPGDQLHGGDDAGGGDSAIPDASACVDVTVHCVDDDAGSSQEYTTIQAAVDATSSGHTVLIFAGTYDGFRVTTSGTANDRIIIRGLGTVNLIGTEPQGNNTIRLNDVSYITIRGFTIARSGAVSPYDYDYACIAARDATAASPMHGIHIIDNEVSGCSPAGTYFSQCEGMLFEGNYFHDNVQEDEGGNGQAIYLSNAGTDNVTFRDNRIEDNAGPGIHMNGDTRVGGDGIQTGHRFYRNIITGNGNNGFNMDGIQDCIVYNNVFANNGRHGMRGYDIDAAEGPKNYVIVNNTFFGNGSSATKFSEDEGGHVIFNNLVVANSDNFFDIAESTPLEAANLILATDGGVFENSGAGNFRLAVAPAAVDQGVASLGGNDAPTDDLNGHPRSGLPDIGAYELGSP